MGWLWRFGLRSTSVARWLDSDRPALRAFATLFALSFFFAEQSLAQSEIAQSRGLDWLTSQVSADGSLASEGNSVATAFQARTEAVRTIRDAGRTVPPSLISALQSLPTIEADATARKALALRSAGIDASALDAQLIALQGPDGGVAAHAQAGATVLDTAWTLRALLAPAAHADLAVSWLRLRQAPSGTWDASPRSPLVTSSVALRALRDAAPRNASAAASAMLAANYLLGARRADGLWDSTVWVNALVFEAVHDFLGTDPTPRAIVRDALLATQSADGSWSQDPYTTALAIRALRLSGIASSPPTQAALALQVADSQTGASLAGVSLSLQGPTVTSATSNMEGRISVTGLAPGNYSATLTLATYTQQLFNFALLADRTIDLGRILLSRSTASTTTARVGGRVLDNTGLPLAEATVTLGALPAQTTDAQGRYMFSSVTPGSYIITAGKGGYLNASAAINAAAATEYDFSPSLQLTSAGSGSDTQGCRMYGYVRRGTDATPISGASVTLGGANVRSAVTDAAGAFLIGSLVTGRTTVAVAAAGYDGVSGAHNLACDAPNAYDFSPNLYATATSPSGANTASMSFALVSAATEQPLAGISVRATPVGQAMRNLVTAQDGRFTVSALSVDSVLIEVAAAGHDPVSVTYQVEPLESKDMGQLRLRPSGTDALLPDLKLVSVRRGSAVTDAQRLTVSGSIAVEVTNAGRAPQPREARLIAFVDLDRDGRFDAVVDRQIGQATLTTLLQPAQSITLSIAVTGTLPFRDAPIHVWIDSEQAIAEINEANNIKSTADAAEVQPAIGTFKPKLKWHWSGSSVHPDYNQVMMAPVIGRLMDTNGDGRVDVLDAPVVAFVTFPPFGTTYVGEGVLRVVHGATGQELLTIRDTTSRISASSALALADLNRDGKPEIIATTVDGRVVAYRNDGSRLWVSDTWVVASQAPFAGISVADLDGDGSPEVLVGRTVFSATGARKWVGSGSAAGSSVAGSLLSGVAIAADLERSGQQNVIVGGSVYSSTGQLLWHQQDGYAAVGDFDLDGHPEIALVSEGTVALYTRQGQLKWKVPIPGGGRGGPPTVADVNGDGKPDIGVAGANAYTVFNGDGSVRWSRTSQDFSSQITGSTVFDFDGDGAAEVLYADELKLRAYRGTDGATLWEIPNSSGTLIEYPLVADVDGDGHADMVIAANDYAFRIVHGIRVYQDENNSWVNVRSLWNQHAYSITNVNDDLTIPARPQPSWLAHNTFRANKRLDISATAVADATASYLRVRDGGGTTPSRITARIGNGGALSTPSGLKVAFYGGTAGTTLLGVVPIPRALSAGEYEDLNLDTSSSLPTIATVRVVADDDGTGRSAITDFDRGNNSVQADLSTIAVSLAIAAATDKPVYTELDTAQFSASVANSGSFSRAAQVRLSVETASGAPVDTLALPASLNVGAGQQSSLTAPWPAAGVLTGAYQLRAELIDSAGLVYATALAPFAVEASHTAHVGSRIGADRVSYNAAQTVQLRSRVFNTTANMLIDELSATTAIANAQGQQVWSQTEPIAQLAPQASREYGYSVPASTLAPGEYTATLTVRDNLGGLRSSSMLRFNVLGTDYSGIGLRGALDVPSVAVALGEQASIAFSVLNAGNTALVAMPLKLRLVDPAANVLRGEYSFTANLAVGETWLSGVNWTAVGVPGDVVAVLAAVIGGREVVLAQAAFKLIESPVRIDLGASARTAADARILVLVSCPVNNGGNDDPACVQQRSIAIDAALTALNFPHRIVSSAAAFEAEFRCGTWNAYWVSGGAIKLSIQLAKELREAVRRGEGLIMDGVHDSRNQLLHPVAGVKQIGKLPGQGHGATIEPGSVFDASLPDTLPTLGQPTRFQPTTGQVAATFGTDPAIVLDAWGEGHSALFAFDLAGMLAAPGGSSNAQHLALLEAAIGTIASKPPLTQGDVTVLATEVVNRGSHAVEIEVRATLPTGVSFIEGLPQAQFTPATATSPAQATRHTTLPVGGSAEFRLRVRIDAATGTLGFPVQVYSISAIAPPKLQAMASHSLVVQGATQIIDDAIGTIEQLSPSAANDAQARNRALSAAQQARLYTTQGNAAGALTEWIKAADALAGIASEDIATLSAAQLGVARAIEASTDRLCTP